MNNLVQSLMNERADWLQHLETELKIDAVRDGDLVSLKYNQIESPMHEPIVQQCRGMVVDVGSRHVIAWPYNKFWNHGEALAAPVDWSTARVQEKLDGSLMILHWHHGWRVASSGHPTAGGSFGNDERTFRDAFWHTWDALGHRLPPDEMRDTTFMFELCDQPNRIVVMHERPRIVLHGARRLTDGREAAYGWLCYAAEQMRCEVVRCLPYTSFAAVDAAVNALDPLQCEGFVVVDDQFNRVKVKSPRYVALHHLKGNATPRRAIELWQTGDAEELLAHFPEFRPVIEPIHEKLDEFARRAVFEHEQAMQCTTDRKGYAALAVQRPFSAVMFRMLTNQRASVDEAKAIMRGMSLAALERMLEAL